jgi:hypothetical protein
MAKLQSAALCIDGQKLSAIDIARRGDATGIFHESLLYLSHRVMQENIPSPDEDGEYDSGEDIAQGAEGVRVPWFNTTGDCERLKRFKYCTEYVEADGVQIDYELEKCSPSDDSLKRGSLRGCKCCSKGGTARGRVQLAQSRGTSPAFGFTDEDEDEDAAAAAGSRIDIGGGTSSFCCRGGPGMNESGDGGGVLCKHCTREEKGAIYECSYLCACAQLETPCPTAGSALQRRRGPRQCGFRWSQKGVGTELMVVRTPDMGWGLYAMEDIAENDFVVTYIGEYITGGDAKQREEEWYNEAELGNYIFSTQLAGSAGKASKGAPVDGISIDATKYRNVSAFVNHSCAKTETNLVIKHVYINHYCDSSGKPLPRIAFFASKLIKAGTQLLVHYGQKPHHCCCTQCKERARMD